MKVVRRTSFLPWPIFVWSIGIYIVVCGVTAFVPSVDIGKLVSWFSTTGMVLIWTKAAYDRGRRHAAEDLRELAHGLEQRVRQLEFERFAKEAESS